MSSTFRAGAVILAAGASRRMGQSKMLLPWGETTVIRQVTGTLLAAGVEEPVVVTGRSSPEIHQCLEGLLVRWAHNPSFETTEMLQSLQIGMRELSPDLDAFLIALGDQPQMEPGIVRQVLEHAETSSSPLIIPSYQMRRGHPWLIRRSLWPELLSLGASATLRNFLNMHADEIEYMNVDSDVVLMDLDTPEDYARSYQLRQSRGN